MGIREERRSERQAAVLDAATELMESHGASAVTIAAVAGRIGASVGGMYRYFPTKQAIFLALQLRSIESFEEFLESRLSKVADSVPAHGGSKGHIDLIIAAFEAWPAFAESSPTHHRLLDEFVSMPTRTLDDAAALAVHERLQSILVRIAGLLERAVEAGELVAGDSMARTHLMWAALHGLGHFKKRDHLQPEPLRVAALRRQLFDSFLVAWGASRTRTS